MRQKTKTFSVVNKQSYTNLSCIHVSMMPVTDVILINLISPDSTSSLKKQVLQEITFYLLLMEGVKVGVWSSHLNCFFSFFYFTTSLKPKFLQ